MLRNFAYLDEPMLNQYIAQVEDGLRQLRSTTSNAESGRSGNADLKVFKAGLDKTTGQSSTEEFTDSAESRFNRLMTLVEGHEDDFDWVRVVSDADMDGVRPGQIVDLTADLYESDVTKLTGPNGMLGMIAMIDKMKAGIPSWEAATQAMPGKPALDAIGAFASNMPEVILQGDVADSWHIIATLPATSNLEGEAQVVGKVRRSVPTGRSEPMPGLPLVEQMPREQRREFIRSGPQPKQQMMWFEGPALVLDVLAIYR